MSNDTKKPTIGKATISGGDNYFSVPCQSLTLDFSGLVPEEVGGFSINAWIGHDRKLHVSAHGTFELGEFLSPEVILTEDDVHLNGTAIKQ